LKVKRHEGRNAGDDCEARSALDGIDPNPSADCVFLVTAFARQIDRALRDNLRYPLLR
jgi:hypothetical protein